MIRFARIIRLLPKKVLASHRYLNPDVLQGFANIYLGNNSFILDIHTIKGHAAKIYSYVLSKIHPVNDLFRVRFYANSLLATTLSQRTINFKRANIQHISESAKYILLNFKEMLVKTDSQRYLN
jgi:hypothetical protein